jgi:hypothetical protein
MAVVTVSDAAVLPASNALAGFELEHPRKDSTNAGYSLTLEGWVVGARSPVVRLECASDWLPPLSLPIGVDRPELAARFPELAWAAGGGFRTGVSTVRLSRDFEMRVDAVLADGSRSPFAVVRGRRAPLLEPPASGPQPLMVTTIGRTGSTWLADLLDQHSEVISLHPYHYEPRAGAYWMEVLAALAEPRSYAQMLAADSIGPHWWMGLDRRGALPLGVNEQAEEWLAGENVSELARFCRERIDGFYREAVEADARARAAYFAEKLWPGSSAQGMLRELYAGAREVFLVRDFRDLACSVLAYGRERGAPLFGRESVDSDEDYVRGPLLGVARAMRETWRSRSRDSHVLRYEDLVLRPSEALASLLSYLELDVDDDVIAGMLAGAPERGGGHQTAESAAASVGRWRRELTPTQLAAFEDFGEALEAFGYDEAGPA